MNLFERKSNEQREVSKAKKDVRSIEGVMARLGLNVSPEDGKRIGKNYNLAKQRLADAQRKLNESKG